MTLTELRFIVILAEEKHFGRAASRCHVSQPTLSIAIKKLEDELGVALFERAKGKVMTTELGAQIITHAQVALEQTLAIKDLADSGRSQLHGILRLGTLSSVGPYWLPQAIAHLQASAPQMPLQIEEGNIESLVKKLRSGKLDVILAQPFSEPEIVTQIICEEDFVLLMPHHHPLAVHSSIVLAEVAPSDILLAALNSAQREELIKSVPGLAGSGEAEASVEMLRLMVASGLGVCMVPRCAALSPGKGALALTFRPFAAPAPKRTLILAWRASFPRHKAIDVLRQALQASNAAYWDFITQRETENDPPLVDNSDW